MPSDEDFRSAAEQAKAIEKSSQPYTGFKGKVEFAKVLDLEPADFADYTYDDLINLYERAGKIIKTSAGIGMYGAPAAPGARAAPAAPARPEAKKEAKARAEEVESRVKALTTESLSKAEEISKEMEKPIEMKKPEMEAKKPEEPKHPVEEIEFERLVSEGVEFEKEEAPEKPPEKAAEEEKKPAREEIEFEMLEKEGEKEEKEKEYGIELEKPEKPEAKLPEAKPKAAPAAAPRAAPVPPAPSAPARPLMAERPAERPAAAVPPILRERAEEAASKKYGEIEQQIMGALGGEVDEVSLKKRMLELTKELFKEKSFNRREQIKLEITVLKDMLARKVKKPAGKGLAEKESRGRMLDTIVSTQKTELAATKDKLLSNYKNQVDAIKQKFLDTVSSIPEEDETGRKAAFDKLTFDLTAITEQLPPALSKYQDYLTEKHQSEIRRLKSSLGAGDAALAGDSDARLKQIDDEYSGEFSTARAIVKKQVETVIETTGRAVFRKAEVPLKEAKVQELVAEINETDEGTLLYFLHSKDPDFYKKYERKHLSRQEAIFRAKELMAREKGLSDDMVRRYFSETEG